MNDGTHDVPMPVVVRPVALAASAQVGGTYNVTFGYSGAFTATPRGLIPSVVSVGTVTQDPDQMRGTNGWNGAVGAIAMRSAP